MFKKKAKIKTLAKQTVETYSETSVSPMVSPIKYTKPKILLIDIDEQSELALKSAGYNVSTGSFGRPYSVPKKSGFQPLVANAKFPPYAEQEIVVIDLATDEPISAPTDAVSAPDGEMDWWAKCNTGVLDPRPRIMAALQSNFDRILYAGGVFIIFADSRDMQEIVWAKLKFNTLHIDREISFDNWSFLSTLSKLNATHDVGEEIVPVDGDYPLVRLLAGHLDGARFYCALQADWEINDRWFALAKNKYGAAVAGVIVPPKGSNSGWVIILPRLKKQESFLAALFKDILPEMLPALFPHAEGQRWVHRSEYELPAVLAREKEIRDVETKAALEVSELEDAIKKERDSHKYLYDLLRETGGSLVAAVQKALSILGFENVVDVDAEMMATGKGSSLREDLRIHDTSPILVVDIKGVTGRPADPDALQAQKHAHIYMQEKNRTDIRGLAIINHQRMLPPLDRDNDMPFRQEILDNAAQIKFGVMTTWDLFRLVRNATGHRWKPEHVKPVLYGIGRIRPVPRHYEYLGMIKQVWKAAFSIQLEHLKLAIGDTVAIDGPVDFEEQFVSSLRLNNVDCEAAEAGAEVGVPRSDALKAIKVGLAVYRVERTPSDRDNAINQR